MKGDSGSEFIVTHCSNGRYSSEVEENTRDLFMAPAKRQGWVNLYRGGAGMDTGGAVYESKDLARTAVVSNCGRYLDTIFIEWEE